MSAANLVSDRGVDARPESLERALRACASLGVLTEDAAGKFGPTELSDVLTLDSPVSVKKFVEVLGANWFCKTWAGFYDAVRTGEPQTRNQIGMEFWDYLKANPTEMQNFGEAMKSNSLNSLRGVLENCDFSVHTYPLGAFVWILNSLRGVLENCDFSGSKKVIDVGGGFGHLAVALLEKYPSLRGAVLDMPDLIPMAKKSSQLSADVASRLEYIGGDMFDAVPAADVYIMKHIIHDWDDERCIRLLRNCHRSMEGEGRVVCVDAVLPPIGDTSGTSAKLMDINMLVLIPGKERTRTQWEELYKAAGFRIRTITPIKDNFGTSIMEGVKA